VPQIVLMSLRCHGAFGYHSANILRRDRRGPEQSYLAAHEQYWDAIESEPASYRGVQPMSLRSRCWDLRFGDQGLMGPTKWIQIYLLWNLSKAPRLDLASGRLAGFGKMIQLLKPSPKRSDSKADTSARSMCGIGVRLVGSLTGILFDFSLLKN